MFSLVLAPMIFFGCAYYPWSALNSFPILQKIVLLNPLVYANEGLRATLAPQFQHMPVWVVLVALVIVDTLLVMAGLNRFAARAIS